MILFQLHTLVSLFGEDDGIEIMKTSPQKEAFERGLSRHRDAFTENQYQMFLAMLGSDNQSVEDVIAGASVLQTREALGEFNECAKKGCSNEGTHLCKRCQIASYCSRSCQKADWKSHKKGKNRKS